MNQNTIIYFNRNDPLDYENQKQLIESKIIKADAKLLKQVCIDGNANFLNYLLTFKNIKANAYGNMPLIHACEYQHIDIVDILLKNPLVDPRDKKNKAFHVACEVKNANIAILLLKWRGKNGEIVDIQNNIDILLGSSNEFIDAILPHFRHQRVDRKIMDMAIRKNNNALMAILTKHHRCNQLDYIGMFVRGDRFDHDLNVACANHNYEHIKSFLSYDEAPDYITHEHVKSIFKRKIEFSRSHRGLEDLFERDFKQKRTRCIALVFSYLKDLSMYIEIVPYNSIRLVLNKSILIPYKQWYYIDIQEAIDDKKKFPKKASYYQKLLESINDNNNDNYLKDVNDIIQKDIYRLKILYKVSNISFDGIMDIASYIFPYIKQIIKDERQLMI
jgi:hypothetical protein